MLHYYISLTRVTVSLSITLGGLVDLERRDSKLLFKRAIHLNLPLKFSRCLLRQEVVYPDHNVIMICTESVLKIMDAGYCLYVHIFVFF